MSEKQSVNEICLKPGTLWTRIQEQTQHGLECGALQSISTDYEYVEENGIERPTDFVVKQVANKSKAKIAIIQGIDRKIPLDDLASSSKMSMEDMIHELEAIVSAGTKVNIDYYLDDAVDEYSREDILDYFMEAETDSVEMAYAELKEDDITLEEIQLMRIKFMSDMGN